ncbi:MAG: hypothetical protein J3Q66DRAFT_333297 [Benniella sp.]|nr:MAG: hypothetical protein J3Q66DRAFT_333297 [Benniella sp.]
MTVLNFVSVVVVVVVVVVAFVSAIQAAPLSRRCSCCSCCHDCQQSVSSGTVSLGSVTKIVPVTDVTPITRLQTIVNSYPPIVQYVCPEPLATGGILTSPQGGTLAPAATVLQASRSIGGDHRFGLNSDYIRRLSRERFLNRLSARYGLSPPNSTGGGVGDIGKAQRPNKRNDIMPEAKASPTSDPGVVHPAAACVPSATQSCEQTVPASTTDMGSIVQAEPSTMVLPSTIYQGHVQSKAAEVVAAEAQHTELSKSQVNLGSNTLVQPVTQVVPSTVYQPSVARKATLIEAAAAEH